MTGATTSSTAGPAPLDPGAPGVQLAERYAAAIGEFAEFGQEDRLAKAYELARSALGDGVSLAEISGIHHAALHILLAAVPSDDARLERIEQFFLEVIAVYDMALQGYRSSVVKLRAEIAERQNAEAQLRSATAELAGQRDALERQVRARTRDLAGKAAALEEANAKLTAINREQAEFTYAISHDLKSPTNTIAMLLTELSRSGGLHHEPDSAQLVELSLQTVARMGRLVEDILGYSRTIEEHPVCYAVDLNRIVAEIVDDLSGDIGEAGATIEVGDLGRVAGDAMQLRLLFQNLIANALKFRSPDRPPLVRVHRVSRSAKEVRIAVADNGIGIAPEYHEQIFGLFQRLHSHDAYPGSGLGLTLCRRIVSNHSGEITLRSEPGRGSAFEVTLKPPPG